MTKNQRVKTTMKSMCAFILFEINTIFIVSQHNY